MYRLKRVLIALAALAVTAGLVWAVTPSTFTDVTVTDDLIVTDDAAIGGTITGDLTGNVTGDLAGAVTATTITASSTAVITGAFDARSTAEFAGAVDCSSTVNVQSTAAFEDSVYFGDDVVATTFTGALTGAVTGNVTGNIAGVVAQSGSGAKGNLPAAASNTGEFFMNAAQDTLWFADVDSWVQIAP